MAKTKISEFSATASSNTDIDGINLAEGMAPSLVNNAIRELMAQLKDQQVGTSGDDFTVGGTLYANTMAPVGSVITINSTGALKVPVGTTAQRPTSSIGQLRYNSTSSSLENYDGANWISVGGATGGGGAIFENANSITVSYTISTNHNAMSAGPITVASGVTVTVPSGSRWVVV
jgi:hypothetical protein